MKEDTDSTPFELKKRIQMDKPSQTGTSSFHISSRRKKRNKRVFTVHLELIRKINYFNEVKIIRYLCRIKNLHMLVIYRNHVITIHIQNEEHIFLG